MKARIEPAKKLFESAINAEETGQINKALRLYEKAASIEKDSPAPGIRHTHLLYSQHRWQEAIVAARQVIKRWPDQSSAYSLLAQSYMEQAQYLRAERAFRQSLAINPTPWNWVFLGCLLAQLGRSGKAIACYRSALKLDPDYEEAHYNLGCRYKLCKQYLRAEKYLRRAIEIDPKYALAYAELGAVLLHYKERIQEAAGLLRKSIRLDPKYGWSRFYLANALWQLDKVKAADEQYRKFIELWPDKPEPYWCYGSFLSSEGNNPSLAEDYLRKSVELDQKNEWANYYLGKHLFDSNRTAEAVKFLRKAARRGHKKAKAILDTIGALNEAQSKSAMLRSRSDP